MRLATVSVVLLVVLAGCSVVDRPGGGNSPVGDGGDGPTDRSQEGPTPTSDSGAGMSSPPGLGPDGVTDPGALFGAHIDALAGTDYAHVLVVRSSTNGSATNRTLTGRSSLDSQRGVVDYDSPNVTLVTYRNATHVLRRQTAYGRTDRNAREAEVGYDTYHRQHATVVNSTLVVLRLGNFSANGTVDRSGRTLVRYELAGVNTTGTNVTEVLDASGTLLVSERGVVHEASIDVTARVNGTARATVDRSYRIRALGNVSVERPSWA